MERRLDILAGEWSKEFEIHGEEDTGLDGDPIYVIRVVDGSGRIMQRETYLLNGRESPSKTSP